MKITRNTTKVQLVKFLNANLPIVQEHDKELFERLTYASKQMREDAKKVSKADLARFVRDVMKSLGDKCVEIIDTPTPVVENSAKPKLTTEKSGKKENTSTKSEEPEVSKEEPEKPKKETKKETSKKQESKSAPTVRTTVDVNSFPPYLEQNGVKYVINHDIKDMKDLATAGEDVMLAMYWNRAQIKQSYGVNPYLPIPKEFENDLDLASLLYVSEAGVVAYALSLYTEALYQISPADFEEIDGVRYTKGIEYEIYVAEKESSKE